MLVVMSAMHVDRLFRPQLRWRCEDMWCGRSAALVRSSRDGNLGFGARRDVPLGWNVELSEALAW